MCRGEILKHFLFLMICGWMISTIAGVDLIIVKSHETVHLPNYYMISSSELEPCTEGIQCKDGQLFGIWYYPDNSMVINTDRMCDSQLGCNDETALVYSENDTLKLKNMDISTSYEGLYRCRINQTEAVLGLYADDSFNKNTGPKVSKMLLSAPLISFGFSLTFNVTNGPPTNISCLGPWSFTVTEESPNVYREVVNNGNATKVTIQVETKENGSYMCNVSNNRVYGSYCDKCSPATSASTSTYVKVAVTPTNLSVSRLGTGLTDVQISWTGSSSKYWIFCNCNISEYTTYSTKSCIRTGLTERKTYSYFVVAASNMTDGTLPSKPSKNATITLIKPTVNITSSELTLHNIIIQWSEPIAVPSDGYRGVIECNNKCGSVMYTSITNLPTLTVVFNNGSLTDNCSRTIIGYYGEDIIVLFSDTISRIPPLSPIDVTVSFVSESSMNISWSKGPCSAPINGYHLSYSNVTHFKTANISGENCTSHSIIGLNPYTNYTITVSAYNKWGTGLPSEKVTATTSQSTPGIVSNLTSKGTDVDEITVSWNEPLSPNGIIIGYDIRYDSNGSMYGYINGTTRTRQLITGLEREGFNYTVHVRAITIAGPGGWEVTKASTRNIETVKDFHVTRINDTAYEVTWALIHSKAVKFYKVYYTSIGSEEEKKFNASTSKGILSNLMWNLVYEFQIVAIYIIGGREVVTIPANFSFPQPTATDSGSLTLPSFTSDPTLAPAALFLSVPFLSGIGGSCIALLTVVIAIVIIAIKKGTRKSSRHSNNIKANSLQAMYTITSNEITNDFHGSDFELSETKSLHRSHEMEVLPTGPIPVHLFGDYVARNHSNCDVGFKAQYSMLTKGEDHHSSKIAVTPTNNVRNRFCNITVYDDNRVILKPLKGQPDHQNDYINASYIKGYTKAYKYIATQGPTPQTVVDFWRLIWQENSPVIVMVTNLEEDMKIKCHQYWPDTGSKSFGPFRVTLTNQQIYIDYTVRTMELEFADTSKKCRSVTQYHFTSWPDHGVPQYSNSMTNFHKHVKKHYDQKGPLTVHCSAGVGRTGTFITIDIAMQQAKSEGIIDIPNIINELRQQRMKMVQTHNQFIFINDAVLENVALGDTQINVSELRIRVNRMGNINSQTGQSEFQKQFEILGKVTPRPDEVPRHTGEQFPEKNRSTNYLPPEKFRLILENNDYIHASFISGYKEKRSFIIAESPMQSTCRNFWKMIIDSNCHAIVMMGLTQENGKNVCCQYWPLGSKPLTFGEFSVALESNEIKTDYAKRVVRVTDNVHNTSSTVIQYQITSWLPSGVINDQKTITHIINEVNKVQRREGSTPVTVHCSDTVTRSGIFCASTTVIEKCKAEKVVDVFQVVKAQRLQKPGSVPKLEHFQFIFEVVLTFLDTFEQYSNFEFPNKRS